MARCTSSNGGLRRWFLVPGVVGRPVFLGSLPRSAWQPAPSRGRLPRYPAAATTLAARRRGVFSSGASSPTDAVVRELHRRPTRGCPASSRLRISEPN